MFTVRWITDSSNKDRAVHTRDETFATKREALAAIATKSVSAIKRMNRLYCVQVRKSS